MRDIKKDCCWEFKLTAMGGGVWIDRCQNIWLMTEFVWADPDYLY
jgi:hypothetical protein